MKFALWILVLVMLSTQAQMQLRGRGPFEQNHVDEYFMQMSPPMDVMVYNHEMEIARMMGSPGTVTMNYIFDSSPYSPGFI